MATKIISGDLNVIGDILKNGSSISGGSSGSSVLYRHLVLISGLYGSGSTTMQAYIEFYNSESTAYTTYADVYGVLGATNINAFGRFTYNSNIYFPQTIGIASSGCLFYAIQFADSTASQISGSLTSVTVTDTVTENDLKEKKMKNFYKQVAILRKKVEF